MKMCLKHFATCILLFITCLPFHSFGQDGTIDPTFNPGTGANAMLHTTVVQPNGKIIITGDFITYNGASKKGLARLESNGNPDASFDPGTGISGVNATILVTALQSDGKILIGGNFTGFNGVARNGIARLNTDGSLDTSFNPGRGVAGVSVPAVRAIVIQPDKKIIIGGDFATCGDYDRRSIARLDTSGIVDIGFSTGASFPIGTVGLEDGVNTIGIQNDGKLIVGGRFNFVGLVARNRIARLETNGTLDPGFNTVTDRTDYISTVAVQADQKILVGGSLFVNDLGGGSFSDINLLRVNENGSIDPGFYMGDVEADPQRLWTILLQSDGKFIISGVIQYYNHWYAGGIGRVNADGTWDGNFNAGFGVGFSPASITQAALQPDDGKVIVVGNFTSFDGVPRNYVARLKGDPCGGSNTKTWTGALSTSWHNVGNWTCGLPNSGSTVVVNAGAGNMPEVTQSVSVKKLTLKNGAVVTVKAGVDLTVTGN
ncbi:MAG: delta-60 repeat domain-containing protein [Bacteroidota bacterium]